MTEPLSMNRREFLWRSALFGAGLTLAGDVSPVKAASVLGANDRVRVGVIGLGARGQQHLGHYLSLPNVEVAAVCDLREDIVRRAARDARPAGSKSFTGATDYRRLLDMADLDAVSIAVPRRLRASVAADTVRAGKHALLEKPFSATASEGKRLAAAVEQQRRLVQQRDEHFFMPASDLFDGGGFQLIDGVRRVRSFKTVFLRALRAAESDANVTGALPEFALDELDVARCLLGVGLPTKVSAVGFSHGQSGPLPRVLTQLEFTDGSGEGRHIRVEVSASFRRALGEDGQIPGDGGPPPVAAYFTSRSDLVGARGEMSIRCDYLRGSSTSAQNFANFITCIRENNRDGLINPLHEARKSNLLLQLTELSLKFERSFDFDPMQERVVGDDEIDEHL